MRDPRKEMDWLAQLPGWFKAGLGFVGTIGTIAGIVLAWRQDVLLYNLIAVVLVLGGLFLLSLYVFLARRKPKSKKTPGQYLYGKYRPAGLIGMVAICLVAAYLLVFYAELIPVAIAGTRVPTLTLTPSPTPTPIPTSTRIPTATPPHLPPADVVIVKFHPIDPNYVQYFEGELEGQLQQDLRSNGLPDVDVRLREDLSVSNEEEAQNASNQTGSKVVIWGLYSPSFIQVRVFLSGGDRAGIEIPGTKQIGLTNSEPSAGLAFKVPGVVAQNLRFLTPFVLGHLQYHSNDYAAGHKAFDFAMANIPTDAIVESEAIVHFFRARERDKSRGQGGSESLQQDTEYVICEYKEALLKDRRLDVAYNNLGLVISRLYGVVPPLLRDLGPEPKLTVGSLACLHELQQNGLIGPDYLDPKMYFRRALEENASLTLAKFNLYAFESLQDPDPQALNTIISEIDKIRQADGSILGTYIILARAKERSGDLVGAIEMYGLGIDRLYLPSGVNDTDLRMELMRFNLGQLLTAQQDWLGAEVQLKNLLDARPNYYPAHLALGNLYYRQRKFAEAASEWNAAVTTTDFSNPETVSSPSNALMQRSNALVLRSGGAFQEGNLSAARQDLSQATQTTPNAPFPHLLLGLLSQVEGNDDLALEEFDTAIELGAQSPSGAWGTFKEKCFNNEEVQGSYGPDWILLRLPLSGCLGQDLSDPRARLTAFYDLLSDDLLQYREAPSFSLTSAQCPYLYTEDPVTGEWEFDTTILYKAVDYESAQIRPLSQFRGKLLIREVEPEVSYLNQLYVIAELTDGSRLTLQPDVEELKRADGDYIVLQQGEEILVTLEDYPVQGEVRQWWVMAVGYYSPLR